MFRIVYAETVTIDTFDEGSVVLTSTSGEVVGGAEHSGILGGEHDLELALTGGGGVRAGIELDSFFNEKNTFWYEAGTGVTGKVTVTWDGDDDYGVLSPTGLTGVNLISGTNDGVVLSVIYNDHNSAIEIHAYSDSSNWSEARISLPEADNLDRFDVTFPFDDTGFSSFSWTDHGTGVDWSSLGALVLFVDGEVSSGLDFDIDNIEASNAREYGDLPSSYGTALDASHIPQVLRLGVNCDTESTSNASSNTLGDDNSAVDDEDGVQPRGTWTDATDGGLVRVIVQGCSDTCYLNGWINWDSDSDSNFTDSGEQIFTDEPVVNGTDDLSFDIPSGTSFDDVYRYARFRICESQNECDTPTAQDVPNGEIEDYRWYWGPTAITLTDVTARSNTLYLALGAVAVAAVGLLGAVVILRRRRA
jgi:hypothetical protein